MGTMMILKLWMLIKQELNVLLDKEDKSILKCLFYSLLSENAKHFYLYFYIQQMLEINFF